MIERSFHIPKRAVTLVSAGTLALAGTLTLATGLTAHATPGDPHQVWVCKYVQKPHQNEILKSGKNPILVDWASLTGRADAPQVGDTFSDGQDKSVVVQIGGSDPGVGACAVTTPPTTTTTKPPPTTTTNPPTTTTQPPTMTSTPPATTTSTPSTPSTTTPSGGGGGQTPGAGAPATGGAGDTNPLNAIVGSGLLLAAGGLVAGDLARRRRQAGNG